jgi:predicted amidohydrolase
MQNLKVSIIQSRIFWEDIKKNLSSFGKKIDSIKDKTDLIILPETFSTAFTMNAKYVAEDMNGYAVNFLREKSYEKKSFICGSVIIKEKNKYYNRLILASPDGEIRYYNKRHLFSMAGENKVFTQGNKQLIAVIKEWRIAFFVCYDLRFPVWCRNKNNYDVAVFVANWPTVRISAWKFLLIARAVENQSYIVGVNRTGVDGNGIGCNGQSAIINPFGEYIINAKTKNGIFSASLNHKVLEDYLKKFPAFKDADKFNISKKTV